MKITFDATEAQRAIDYIFDNNHHPWADNKTEVGKSLYKLLEQVGRKDVNSISTGGFHVLVTDDSDPDEKSVEIHISPSFKDENYITIDVPS